MKFRYLTAEARSTRRWKNVVAFKRLERLERFELLERRGSFVSVVTRKHEYAENLQDS
jgi:hypothetical protein